MPETQPNSLGRALSGFFGDYLTAVRGNSRHTVLSYRDAFKLLLRFLEQRLGRSAATLDFPDLTPETVLAFLDHLERHRANSVATRNNRLAALHAFARYAAANYPEHLGLCQQLLALPPKRGPQRAVEYLERHEMQALLQAPDTATAEGRRDRALLLALYNTGARVQEILDVRPRDLQLERPRQVRLFGKGRKERVCPLWPETAAALKALRQEQGLLAGDARPLFRNRHGQPLGRCTFARYAAANYPEHLGLCQQLPGVEYLERHEMQALLQAPDTATAAGCPCAGDPHGVARDRGSPESPATGTRLAGWRRTTAIPQPPRPAARSVPGTSWGSMPARRPSLAGRSVHPHVIRNTVACHLLESGVDIVTISHWLGHASLETTNRYAAVGLAAKREAIEKARATGEIAAEPAEWQADQTVLAWLESL